MKALAFKQPWAWCVLHAGKILDNRQRKDGKMPPECRHRGPLLIHASAQVSAHYWRDARSWALEHAGVEVPTEDPRGVNTALPPVHFGGIVGRCVVVAHVDPEGRVWETESDRVVQAVHYDALLPAVDLRRWHMDGSYGLWLTEIEVLPFTPWKGCLGIFEVPAAAVGLAEPPEHQTELFAGGA